MVKLSPRPLCKECGCPVDPKKAAVIERLDPLPTWVSRAENLTGIYCSSDHLLNAYLRGIPLTLIKKAPKGWY